MYIRKLIFFMAIFLMALPNCFSQQFTYPWNFYDSTGSIQDMHFMPGDSEFIYTTDGNMIRVRNTETGELKREWTGIQGKFAMTADSQNIILVNKEKIEVRNIIDMSIVASDTLELGADSIDPQWQTKLYLEITQIALDPIKPFAYLVISKTNHIAYPTMVDTTLIVAYNYKTMKMLNQFTKKDVFDNFFDAKLNVSRDGKYLAVLNNDAAYLQVWDLPTLKQIRKVPLFDTQNYDQDPENYTCRVTDIRFSEINPENIYFSGCFPNDNYENNLCGLIIYNIQANAITDTTFARIGSGAFTFFDNEQRILTASVYNLVLNSNLKNIEYKSEYIHTPAPGAWGGYIIYSSKYDLFIGKANSFCSSGIYNRGTSAEKDIKLKNVLFPNPTSGMVTIETDCSYPTINYSISNESGDLINSSSTEINSNKIKIDFSSYPNGIYFLTLSCGTITTTYKIIREG